MIDRDTYCRGKFFNSPEPRLDAFEILYSFTIVLKRLAGHFTRPAVITCFINHHFHIAQDRIRSFSFCRRIRSVPEGLTLSSWKTKKESILLHIER